MRYCLQLYWFWGPSAEASPHVQTVSRLNKEKPSDSKGFEPRMVQGLTRCGWRVSASASSSLVSGCNKIGTWNVRSLFKPGKLSNVLSEMKRMGVGIMGVSETFWNEDGSFSRQLPESKGGDKY